MVVTTLQNKAFILIGATHHFSHSHSKINIYGEQFNENGQNNSITRQLNYDKVTSGYLVLETHYYITTNQQELTIIMIRKLTVS